MVPKTEKPGLQNVGSRADIHCKQEKMNLIQKWGRALCVLLLVLWYTFQRATATTNNGTGCGVTCKELSAHFGPAFHSPGNGDGFVVWDAKQQHAQSACRVEPSTSEEIAYAVERAVKHSCRFAVKGGGHARYADDSVSVGGVTIDLVRMKAVDVTADRTSARLGAGHVLYTLYTGLEAYNLSTTAGRVADVGLGGYALGGGISNLSPKYGLAVDNILEYEVILPNSSVIFVNEKQYPDLYFALRGGMNNFGIVSHFTMRVFPQGQMFSGSRSFAVDQREAVTTEAYKLTTEWNDDTNMAFSYGFAYNQASDSYFLSVTEAYTVPISNPPPFEKLNSLPYVSSTLRTDWMSNFSVEGASARPPGNRNLYATLSYYPSISLDTKIQDIAVQEMVGIKHLPGFSPNVIFQPLYESAVEQGRARGGNALGIEAQGPLTMVLLTIGWHHPEDDQAINEFAARFVERSKKATEEAGMSHRWMYINYASQQQDPFSGYGERNRQRLKRIQKEVDPDGIFTSKGLCRGYFKLN